MHLAVPIVTYGKFRQVKLFKNVTWYNEDSPMAILITKYSYMEIRRHMKIFSSSIGTSFLFLLITQTSHPMIYVEHEHGRHLKFHTPSFQSPHPDFAEQAATIKQQLSQFVRQDEPTLEQFDQCISTFSKAYHMGVFNRQDINNIFDALMCAAHRCAECSFTDHHGDPFIKIIMHNTSFVLSDIIDNPAKIVLQGNGVQQGNPPEHIELHFHREPAPFICAVLLNRLVLHNLISINEIASRFGNVVARTCEELREAHERELGQRRGEI